MGGVVGVAPHRVALHLQRLQPHQALQLDQGAQALDLVVRHVQLLQARNRLQSFSRSDSVPSKTTNSNHREQVQMFLERES